MQGYCNPPWVTGKGTHGYGFEYRLPYPQASKQAKNQSKWLNIGWVMVKIVNDDCFVHNSVNSWPFCLYLGSFWRANLLGHRYFTILTRCSCKWPKSFSDKSPKSQKIEKNSKEISERNGHDTWLNIGSKWYSTSCYGYRYRYSMRYPWITHALAYIQ